MCSLPGDHLAGLDCLSDELVLPLLLAMDSESLLKVGRTSQRLFSLVCDRQVWRHLLKGLDFTEEQVLVQKGMTLAEHQAQLAQHQAQLAEHQAQLAEQVLKNEEEALDDLADAWSSSMAGRTSPAPRNRICR